MAVILEKGIWPRLSYYILTCLRCHTKAEFCSLEGTKHNPTEGKDTLNYTFVCPICEYPINAFGEGTSQPKYLHLKPPRYP